MQVRPCDGAMYGTIISSKAEPGHTVKHTSLMTPMNLDMASRRKKSSTKDDMREEELRALFNMLDKDNSGKYTYCQPNNLPPDL